MRKLLSLIFVWVLFFMPNFSFCQDTFHYLDNWSDAHVSGDRYVGLNKQTLGNTFFVYWTDSLVFNRLDREISFKVFIQGSRGMERVDIKLPAGVLANGDTGRVLLGDGTVPTDRLWEADIVVKEPLGLYRQFFGSGGSLYAGKIIADCRDDFSSYINIFYYQGSSSAASKIVGNLQISDYFVVVRDSNLCRPSWPLQAMRLQEDALDSLRVLLPLLENQGLLTDVDFLFLYAVPDMRYHWSIDQAFDAWFMPVVSSCPNLNLVPYYGDWMGLKAVIGFMRPFPIPPVWNHEVAHWCLQCVPWLETVAGHTLPNNLIGDIFSCELPWEWREDGFYLGQNTGLASLLELYLMGLLPKSQVNARIIKVKSDSGTVWNRSGSKVFASFDTLNFADLPDVSPQSPNSRVLFLFFSNRFLNSNEAVFFDALIRWYAETDGSVVGYCSHRRAYHGLSSVNARVQYPSLVEVPLGSILPTMFLLEQNYPNPFNSSTVIRFSVPKTDHVSLVVFNILGQKAETLIDDRLGLGNYQVEWDGTLYPAGLYYYQMKAGTSFAVTKKMILIK